MNELKIKAELKNLIDQETDLEILEMVKEILGKKFITSSIEKEMISRALKSEKDIKEGKLYTPDEAEARLKKNLGL